MPILKRLVWSAVVMLAVIAPCRADERTDRVDALFAEWDREDSPGCALAVIEKGRIVYERGYGMADLEHGVPITPETVFYAGSVSKQFVAAAVALLEEEGRLAFTDDIRDYIPEFPDYGATVTIRNLIHHTSGIRDDLELWELTGRSYLDYMPGDAVLDLICRQRELNFTPGERYMYSNSCYFLLSVIVERVAGTSLREWAAENMFRRLNMTSSHFHDDYRHIVPDRAFGYTRREDGGFGTQIMRFDLVGSGGLYTTVHDLAKWDGNFYHNRLGQRRAAFIDTLHSRGWLNNGTYLDYAFAMVHGEYRGIRTVDHAGALGGYRAHYLRFPGEGVSVAILSNLDEFNPGERAYQVADIWLEDRLGPPPAAVGDAGADDASGVSVSAAPPENSEDYTGRYFSPELDTAWYVTAGENGLMAGAGNASPEPLIPTGDDTFSRDTVTIRFQRDGGGRVTGFSLDTPRVKHLAFERL